MSAAIPHLLRLLKLRIERLAVLFPLSAHYLELSLGILLGSCKFLSERLDPLPMIVLNVLDCFCMLSLQHTAI